MYTCLALSCVYYVEEGIWCRVRQQKLRGGGYGLVEPRGNIPILLPCIYASLYMKYKVHCIAKVVAEKEKKPDNSKYKMHDVRVHLPYRFVYMYTSIEEGTSMAICGV